jgi:gliding motility-associated-like protein
VLEFNFIPLVDHISFNFLFASEEYGTFQCDYSDAFAFILTNNTTLVSTNLAVIPNTDIPVSVTTIHDEAYNPFDSCGSANPEYFGNFYDEDLGTNPLGAPINFNGVTVPLTASGNVQAGTQYHIKLVIADRLDTLYDSAVFLEGGSFDIGNVELGTDFLQSAGNAICYGDTVTINSGLDPDDYTFVWENGDGPMPGETNPTLVVVAPGIYTVKAQFINTTCLATDSITVEFFEDVPAGTPLTLTQCDGSGTATFDLTENDTPILNPFPAASHTTVYFLTEDDAVNNNLANAITTPTAYEGIDGQIIYVRVNKNGTSCHQVVSFALVVQDLTPQYTLTGNTAICPNGATAIEVMPIDNNFDVNGAGITYAWTFNESPLAATGPVIAIDTTTGNVFGDYTITVNNSGCSTTQSFAITESNTVWDFGFTGPTSLCPDENGQVVVSAILNNTEGSPVTYTYTKPDATTVVSTQPTLDIDEPGDYSVTVNILGCETTKTLNVAQSISNWLFTLTPEPQTLCPDETGVLTVNVTNGPVGEPITYTYTLPDNSTVVSQSNTLDIDSPGEYSVSVNILGCENSQPPVTIDESNTVWAVSFVGAPYTICHNESVDLVFTADNFDINNPNAVYTWTLPDGTTAQGAVISANQVGEYHLNIDILGCTGSATVQVNENTNSVSFEFSSGCNETNDYVVEVLPVNNSFDIATSTFAWSGPAFTAGATPNAIIATAIGTYSVNITTADGCVSVQDFTTNDVSCDIQKGISPNNDGKNDSFDLTALNVNHLTIFNRYGTEVYQYSQYTNQWHGQSNAGDELPDATYFYVIEKQDGKKQTGWIYINR